MGVAYDKCGKKCIASEVLVVTPGKKGPCGIPRIGWKGINI
jgi:hypothetical protein